MVNTKYPTTTTTTTTSSTTSSTSSQPITISAHDSRKLHPLKHAVMQVIDRVARGELCRRTVSRKRKSVQNDNDDDDQVSCNAVEHIYLCTGYDLYVTREPCVM